MLLASIALVAVVAPAIGATASGRANGATVAILSTSARADAVTLTARAVKLPAARFRLERLGPRGWRTAAPISLEHRRRRLLIRWRPPAGPASVSLRIRALARRSGRTLALSKAVTVALRPPRGPAGATAAMPVATAPAAGPAAPGSGPPPPATTVPAEASFRVPADTRLYEGAQIAAAEAGPDDSQAVIELAPGTPPPVVGGHVALGPAQGLPDGMFARVLEVNEWDGTPIVLVEQAAIDEVLDDVDFEFDGPVSPTVVDEEGRTVSEQHGAKTVLRLAAGSPASDGGVDSPFECKDSSNVPKDPDELWKAALIPFPVEISIQNTHALHRFDTGSVFPARDPYFLLQFSGEATAKIGFEPKAAFSCKLSTAYRRSHRLQFRVGAIGPVPVTVYLEPTLEFEVSASGGISVSQKHFFSITLEKDGFAAPDFRLAHSADPPDVELGAKLEASVFAGGDLSVMAGAGFGSLDAQAGVFGAFGPEASLAIDQDDPGCVDFLGRLKTELGVRFELWVKRWSFQLASLSTQPTALHDPVCAFAPPQGDEGQPVQRSGTPQAFDFVPPQGVSSYLTLPAADGWWLVGEQFESGEWQYRWLDPAGNPGASWNSPDQPLSFARGADGAIVAATQTPDGNLRLTRFGTDGPESERVEQASPYAPFVQRLAAGVGGHIYLLARLASSPDRPSQGTFRLDPLTLQTTGYAPLSGDNPGLAGDRDGVTGIDYDSSAARAPYASFGLHPPAEPVVALPTTHQAPGGYMQFSVGEGGDIADVDLQSRECPQLTTSVRHPDGTAWTKSLADLVEGDVSNCRLDDIDALPDGGVAYTLRGDDGTYILTAGPTGDRLALTRLGPFGLNPTSVVDATGVVVTAFTERFDCVAANEPSEKCSQVRVVGERAGDVLWSETLHSADQTMMPFTGFVGRPSLTIGKNQVGIQLLDAEPNTCGSDNCTPYSATADFQTLVKPLDPGLRPSFVWW